MSTQILKPGLKVLPLEFPVRFFILKEIQGFFYIAATALQLHMYFR